VGRHPYVPLGRKFARVDDVGDDFSPEFLRWLGRTLDWESLTAARCTVVLGEAGTGKTAELRARAQSMRAAGATAFFVPIEDIAAGGVERALRADSSAFQSWKNGAATACFFLDSVDESKLKGQPLAAALRVFEDELGPGLTRAHVLISSRASDWRSSEDDATSALAARLSGDGALVVQLLPLNEQQLRGLAEAYGLADVDAFIAAIRAADAWPLAERPLDVQWLVAYWLEHHRFGTYSELVAYAIDKRLQERPGRTTLLPVSDARVCAGKLALACVLTQRSALLLPDNFDPRATDALDPREILPDLTNAELDDLLTRALFDEATYGRVRIHHRTVRDFLAAEHVKRLRAAGLSHGDLEVVLFRRVRGRLVVPRHIAGMAAWMAIDDERVRRVMIEHAPQHLIDEGDPSALEPSQRVLLLKAYAEKFGDRESVFHHFDRSGLKRFAAGELHEMIRMLFDADPSDHLKLTLLQMIEAGRLGALAEDALCQAEDTANTPRVRGAAVRAAARAGSRADKERLARLLTAENESDVIHELLMALFPDHLSAAAVAQALFFVRSRKHRFTSIDVVMQGLAKSVTPALRSELLDECLKAALALGPSERLETRYRVFFEQLADVTAMVIDDAVNSDAVVKALTMLQPLLESADGIFADDVRKAVEKSPTVRQRMFWAHVSASTKPVRRADELFPNRLTIADASWLEVDCVRRPTVRERLLAFDALAMVLARSDLHEAERAAALERAARASGEGNADHALAKRLARWRNPPPSNVLATLAPHMLRHRARELRRLREGAEARTQLGLLLSDIRAGKHLGALDHLFHVGGLLNERGAPTLARLKAQYGDEIADAAAAGFRAFWKEAQIPPLETAGYPHVSTEGLLSLAGVALDYMAGVDLAGLPEPLIERLVRIGSHELNSFPVWFEAIAETHPSLVARVLEGAMRRDFDAPQASNGPQIDLVVSKLSRSRLAVQRAVAARLLDWLMASEPKNEQALDEALTVLLSARAIDVDALGALARKRLEGNADSARFAIWWCAWVDAAPSEAVRYLDAWPHKTSELIEVVAARLWRDGDARRRPPPTWGRSAEALAALIPIVFKYVPTAGDATHNGAYTPSRRDDAQDLRRSLLGWLAELPVEESTEALERLLEDERLRDERDSIEHLIEVNLTTVAGARALSVMDAARFVREGLTTPRTGSKLFALVKSKLDDVAEYVRAGDFSVRDIYNPKEEPVLEAHAQYWLAQELDHRRRSQYTVERESETTRENKPDIRVRNAACEGPVTLELKIAERWSLIQLEEALQSQLVDLYMQHNQSRYGLLVLCSSGPKKVWGQEERLSFVALVEHLATRAAELVAAGRVLGLAVVAIDFH
jgi:hypothetical protein